MGVRKESCMCYLVRINNLLWHSCVDLNDYVQVGVKKHSQRQSLAIISKNMFKENILPSSIYANNSQRKFLHEIN